MIFIIYAKTTATSISQDVGEAEYSYHFVLKSFRPVLERLGSVVEVFDQPEVRVDAIYDAATALGENCLFLSFTPPHKTLVHLRCPTVSVFAWEFYDLPRTMHQDVREDWGFVLRTLGGAITHSKLAAKAVQTVLGEEFPVAVIPAPVWNAFAPRDPAEGIEPALKPWLLEFSGHVWEAPSLTSRVPVAGDEASSGTMRGQPASDDPMQESRRCRLHLEGIVYTAAFNPHDGRKNWQELVRCFGLALGDRPDATLMLKVIQNGSLVSIRRQLLGVLRQLEPMRCRIVLLDAYLDSETYRRLMRSTTYVVNASFAEGQCLPLMESMSAGRPAIAPPHTGMADYLDASNAFLIPSTREPTVFPDDRSAKLSTWRHRIDAHALFRAFQTSYRVATKEPDRYREMSRNATETLRNHCSMDSCEKALHRFLAVAKPREQPRIGLRDTRADIEREYFAARCRLSVVHKQRQPVGSELPSPGPVEDIPLHFIIAGFAKCGTTSLTAMLNAHPQLCVPVNENWHFSPSQVRTPDPFAGHFLGASQEQKLGICGVTYSARGDEEGSRERILHHYPDIRIIFVARDPIERIESAYLQLHHSWHHTASDPPPFDVGETLRQVPDVVLDSMYGARFANYARYLAPDQMHVLFFEDLVREPGATLRRCFEFLGVDPEVSIRESAPRLNSRSSKLCDTPQLRAMLDLSRDRGVALAMRVLPLEVRDQFAQQLGLRRHHAEHLPGWTEEVQQRVAQRLAEDARAFLRTHGKDERIWPRLAKLIAPSPERVVH